MGQCGHVTVDAWCPGTGAGAHTRTPRPGPGTLASSQSGLCPPLCHTHPAMAAGRASHPPVDRGPDDVLYRVRLCTTFILGRVATRLGAAGAGTEGAGPGADAPGAHNPRRHAGSPVAPLFSGLTGTGVWADRRDGRGL